MSDNKNNIREAKRKASLYTIISICTLIAGSAAYLTAKRSLSSQMQVPAFSTEITAESKTNAPYYDKVNEIVSGIPDNREELTSFPDPAEQTTQEQGIERAPHFTLPIDSTVTKEYSDSKIVYSKTMNDWRSHNGIDLSGTMGDPIIAVNNGVVKEVYTDTLWGVVVEIDHGDGLIAKYCGLGNGSTVKAGDKVKINQRIGNLSEIPIEKDDGIHLHFETTLDGMTINPLIALGIDESELH